MANRDTFLALTIMCGVSIVAGNNAPIFTGTYPQIVSFDEGTANPAGTELFRLTATDVDGVTPRINYTWDPVNEWNYLVTVTETTSSGATTSVVTLATGKELDYEGTSTYTVYVNAFDGVDYAGKVLVTLQVNDVGETPTLDPATDVQNFSISESPTGTIIGHPAFTIMDGDELESHTWSITGGTGSSYINVYSVNGTALLKSDFDLETAGTPTEVYVDVKIVDKYGLSVTLTYSVFVSDTNDNLPMFDPTVYAFELNQTLTVGTVLATFNATDADATSPNNEITFSLDNSFPLADYFTISGSELQLAYPVDITYGTGPFVFYALATDGGSPAYTATATLSVTVPPATTAPTTTTDVPPAGSAFMESTQSVALMIMACFIAACVLGYVLMLCWRFHTFGECLPSRCPTSQECNKCCECCHGDNNEDEERITGLDDVFGPTIAGPSSKKGLEAMGTYGGSFPRKC